LNQSTEKELKSPIKTARFTLGYTYKNDELILSTCPKIQF